MKSAVLPLCDKREVTDDVNKSIIVYIVYRVVVLCWLGKSVGVDGRGGIGGSKWTRGIRVEKRIFEDDVLQCCYSCWVNESHDLVSSDVLYCCKILL